MCIQRKMKIIPLVKNEGGKRTRNALLGRGYKGASGSREDFYFFRHHRLWKNVSKVRALKAESPLSWYIFSISLRLSKE